jgi:hypothetical protein
MARRRAFRLRVTSQEAEEPAEGEQIVDVAVRIGGELARGPAAGLLEVGDPRRAEHLGRLEISR